MMKGWALWITGLPSSGKSTIVTCLEARLKKRRARYQVLSIDLLRKVITPNPSYSEEERELVYSSLVFTAYILTLNGINVVIDATGNRRRYREKARNLIIDFYEAYIKCPLELCMKREREREDRHGAPEKIYEKGLTDRSITVPGVGVPYEEPLNPEIIVESNLFSSEEAADKIMQMLESKSILKKAREKYGREHF